MTTLAEQRQDTSEPALLRIEAWRDEVVEAHGHHPRSRYATRFWLPIVGPSSLVTAGWLVDGLGAAPDGFDVDLVTLGQALGLPGRAGGHAKIVRTLDRLGQFGLARLHHTPRPLYRVRLAWPPLTQRQLSRLPAFLVRAHSAA
ncbi:MAG: hypothetical protein ACRD1K_08115 [Acidimicrobiales bacterium]